jgi:hypothetical protein
VAAVCVPARSPGALESTQSGNVVKGIFNLCVFDTRDPPVRSTE